MIWSDKKVLLIGFIITLGYKVVRQNAIKPPHQFKENQCAKCRIWMIIICRTKFRWQRKHRESKTYKWHPNAHPSVSIVHTCLSTRVRARWGGMLIRIIIVRRRTWLRKSMKTTQISRTRKWYGARILPLRPLSRDLKRFFRISN